MSDSAVADPALGDPAADRSGAQPPTASPTGRPRPANRLTPDPGLPAVAGLNRWLSLLLALIGGLTLTFAFPGYGYWPLAPIAVAGLALATRGQRAGTAAAAGYLFGLGFFVPHLHWSGIYVGPVPWFALAGFESLFLAAMGWLLPRIWRVPGGAAGTTLAGAGLWVAMEAARDRVPFGGFPWGRLAFSQAQAPTVGLAALGGAPLVTAVVAASGCLLAWAIVRAVQAVRAQARPGAGWGGRGWWAAGLAVPAIALLLTAGLAVPLPVTGQLTRVAAVQGNVPRAGLEFNAQRRAVLDDHVRVTMSLAARVRAGTAKAPDLVIWPENSSDIDPLRNPDAAAVIDEAVAAIKAPTLIGAVIDGPGDKLSNTSIVWRPGTGPGTGPASVYVKRHPAPFAEYIPYRSFFRHFSSKVDLVRQDFVSGDKLRQDPVGVLAMGQSGRVRVGDVICFEVAYDNLVRDPVKQGATLIAVQTNNATFGHSAESVQQLAMSQLRAVETGRTVVHISTVGVSAIILPDGTVRQRSGSFTPDVLEADVPLRTSLTVATKVGVWPEAVLALLGFGLLGAGGIGRGRAARRAQKQGIEEE